MSVDIDGYYGAYKPYNSKFISYYPNRGYYSIMSNPYGYRNFSYYPYSADINQERVPKDKQAHKPYKKSVIPQIVASGLSIAGLIVGTIFLKKGTVKLSRYLKSKRLIKKLKYKKLRFYASIRRLFRRKKTRTD